MFQGRFKAKIIDDDDPSYFRIVADYIHLNPAAAGVLDRADPELKRYGCSSFPDYLKAPSKRPAYLGTSRLLFSHGIGRETGAGRQGFAREEAKGVAEAVPGLGAGPRARAGDRPGRRPRRRDRPGCGGGSGRSGIRRGRGCRGRLIPPPSGSGEGKGRTSGSGVRPRFVLSRFSPRFPGRDSPRRPARRGVPRPRGRARPRQASRSPGAAPGLRSGGR